MKKLFLACFAAIAMFVVRAATETVNGIKWSYIVNSDKAEIYGGSSSAAIPTSTTGAITIPSTLGGYSVTSIGYNAFYGCSSLTSVTIPNSVASIGNYAFEGCSEVENMIIPNSVIRIGARAFKNCTSLESVILSDKLAMISHELFRGCISLTNCVIPHGISEIGSHAFDGCISLQEIVIPKNVKIVSGRAFMNCSKLRKLSFESGLQSIDYEAFQNCIGLTDVVLPNTVTNLCVAAFRSCSNLVSVALSSNLERIEGGAFQYCVSLKEMVIPSSVKFIGGTTFSRCRSLEKIVLPKNLDYIGGQTFLMCSSLKEINIPDSVRFIGEGAFNGCRLITSLKLPSKLEYIGDDAFCDMVKLDSLVIPDGVRYIGSWAFSDCENLNAIKLGNKVREIGEGAFWGCKSLSTLQIPESVVRIGCDAFWDCNDELFDRHNIPGFISVDGWIVEGDCESDLDLSGDVVLKNCRGIADGGASTSIYSTERVKFQDGFKSIGSGAFEFDDMLKHVEIPKSVEYIGEDAFRYCAKELFDTNTISGVKMVDGWVVEAMDSSMVHVDLSKAKGIMPAAFDSCDDLESVVLPKNITRIEDSTFFACRMLGARQGTISIPKSVKYIGGGAFEGCESIKSIVIPEGVEYIGDDAFAVDSVTNIVIPSSVIFIGEEAFNGQSTYGDVKTTTAKVPLRLKSIVEDNYVFNENILVTYYDDGNGGGGNVGNGDAVFEVSVVVANGCEAMGTVTGGKTAKAGTKLTLKATANKGYVFSHWEGPLDESVNPRTPSVAYVVGEDDAEFIAHFIPIEEDWVDVWFEGLNDEYETNGEIGDINVCVEGASLSTVKVVGLPAGLKFTNKAIVDKKSGDVLHEANTIYGTPTKSGVYTVTATATSAGKKTDTATAVIVVRKEGEQIVKLNVSNWHDEDNGTEVVPGKVTGAGIYAEGKKVTLKATANKGFVFAGWWDIRTGNLIDSFGDYLNPVLSYVMGEDDVEIEAVFIPVEEDWVEVWFEGLNDEYETNGEIGDINVCVEGASLSTVKVVGLPSGLKFTDKAIVDKKSGDVLHEANTIYGTPTKSGVYTITATATSAGKKTDTETAVIVVRKPSEQIVKVDVCNLDDEDNDTEVVPGKVTGAGIYAEGKKVTLKATANKGFVFAGWWDVDADDWFNDGDGDYRDPSLSFEMGYEDKVIEAKFTSVEYDDMLELWITVDTVRRDICNDGFFYEFYEITENADDNVFLKKSGMRLHLGIESFSLPKAVVSGLPKGMKFDSKSNMISGDVTTPGLYTVTVKLTNATVKKAIEKKFTIEVPNLTAANDYFYDYLRNDEGEKCSISAGVANAGDLLPSLEVMDGVKLAVSGLPTGLKYDAKTGKITGVATKAGNYTVTLTVTDGKAKYVSTMTIEVEALPDWAAGTFSGLVGRYEGDQEDDDFRAQGSLSMTVMANGKISAKVLLKGKTYSFSSPSYVGVEAGAYLVQLETKAGDILELAISEQEVLSVLGEGAFLRAADDEEFYALVWRNEHGAKNRLGSNSKAAGAIGAIAKEGTVYLSCIEDEGRFERAESSKKYDLKLSVNAKSGVVTYSGNVDGIRVSGSEFLKFDCVEDNYYYIIADLVVYDKKTDTVLYFAFGWDVEVDENGEYVVSEDFSLNSRNIKTEDKTERDMVQLWEGGPYWATKNIGAEKPEDYGYYFWWGDTVGYKPSGGTLNDIGDYEGVTWVSSKGERMANSPFVFGGTCPTYGKNNATLLSAGYIDSTGSLAPEHDAAHVHWGNGWRMPTEAEFDALKSNCDWMWTTLNGVNGYVVKGRGAYASKSIFLPAAGYGDGTSLYGSGSNGYYWSSVPYSDVSSDAWSLIFHSSYLNSNGRNYRYYGQSVRPVLGFTK